MEKGDDTGVVRFSVVRTVGMGIALGKHIILHFPLVFTHSSDVQLASSLAQGCCKEVIKKARGRLKRLPRWHNGKESPCQPRRCRDTGLITGSGISPE